MQPILIAGAQVILTDSVTRADLLIEDGTIAALDAPAGRARVIDASDMILAPALVDIHGDAFERQIMPRPGVFFPTDAALMETDRQLVSNGIATAFHALTLGWEPGLRSVERGREITGRLAALAPRLGADNRVQLRWETFCFEAEALIAEVLSGPALPSVAFNDHTSMALLDPSVRLQDRPFEFAPDFPRVDTSTPAFAAKIDARARRSGLSQADYVALIDRMWQRRAEVPDAIARVGALATAAGASMLSHDDTQPETRAYYRDRGARIAEFPMNLPTARAARAAGDSIVFGAPNVLRGGSHIGSPSAAGMVADGLCDILASDYYYPAMLSAVARLHAEGTAPLHRLWQLISTAPARASHLSDRGEIAPGQRADLVLVDWPDGAPPAIRMTLSAGRIVYDTGLG
ncbi:phosphonate metabolism protein PhnM [Oceanicola sp. 22II-s10i]|uniref:alpha-D-ribose 1-methylphosphonate 5-triphosphate diphosphatase n=1 Tax=Oceanicola sp. 22II-s10i TaxID=1317116 RepID=UPI000B52596B|nr:alpha-D-ribose 1-methylphosphonate 5-triphosphate diphosphatase [Oceanicola sp. 22II-s10i]OWU84990.1 phosphonate metabolism protein PhnM [Oceanicola sp. 22II-s10i]